MGGGSHGRGQRTMRHDNSVPLVYNSLQSAQQASGFEKPWSPKNQARLPFHFLIPPNYKVLCICRMSVGLRGLWGILPSVWSCSEARAPQLLAWGWNLQWAILWGNRVMTTLSSCHGERQWESEWEPLRSWGMWWGAVCPCRIPSQPGSKPSTSSTSRGTSPQPTTWSSPS